jgi:uncharacterized protein YukE
MTDNEIIKALEDLIENFDGKAVDFMTISVALNLINRQRAEIEMLKSSAELWEGDARQFFNERQTIKAEAVKEFAERLKEHKHECGCNYRKKPVYAVTEEKIDNLVKEMVGEG